MTRKVRITFPDIGKVNPYTRTKISEHAWKNQFDKWQKEDSNIFILSYFENDPSANGFGRATRIGDVKAMSLDFPTLVLEGYLYTDDPLVLGQGFDFHVDNEIKLEDFDPFSFNSGYKIVSMEINQINPSPTPVYDSTLEYLSSDLDAVVSNPDSDNSSFRCIECKEPFEEFEHIVKYRGNYYHESCFLEIAIEILQAKELHLDINGNIAEEIAEDFINPLTSIFNLD